MSRKQLVNQLERLQNISRNRKLNTKQKRQMESLEYQMEMLAKQSQYRFTN